MALLRTAWILVFALLMQAAQAQQAAAINEYIQQYKSTALNEMVRSKIPASITLAQGIHESNCGKSPLAKQANNHFGIKCKEEWAGKKYYHDDDAPQECFRVYEHAEASYSDHSDFLVNRPRYANLFLLKITDYKSWAYGLKAAGYATNPQYPVILINLIEEYKLYEYDQVGLAMIEQKDKQDFAKAEKSKNESVVIISDVTSEAPSKHHHVRAEKEHVAQVEAKQEENKAREIFEVNGVKATKAIGAEDPLKVAMEFGVDYAFIMMYNDLTTGDRFTEGENIFLQPKRPRGSEETYTVKQGESMRHVAQRFGIRMKDLYLKNQMRMNDQPHAGEQLNLVAKRSGPPRTMSYADYLRRLPTTTTETTSLAPVPVRAKAIPDADASSVSYEVQKTDTLYSIARKYGVTVDQIKEWNGLDDASLSVGQKLVVSK